MARQLDRGLSLDNRQLARQTVTVRANPGTRTTGSSHGYAMLRQWVLPAMLMLSAAASAWAGYCAYRLYQAVDYNRQLPSNKLSGKQDMHAIYNDAWRLAERGVSPPALALYSKVADGRDEALAASASYNSGNLYLSQAQQLLEAQGLAAWDSAGPLLGLAKLSYQRALKLRPYWYEAKYNLELALRLSPNIQSTRQKPQDDEQEDVSERSSGWPAIPGFPRGMP